MSLCENSFEGRPCFNEDMETCEQCQAWLDAESKYWRYEWEHRKPIPYYRECCGAPQGMTCEPGCDGGDAEYRRDMIDAGRGHLVGVR